MSISYIVQTEVGVCSSELADAFARLLPKERDYGVFNGSIGGKPFIFFGPLSSGGLREPLLHVTIEFVDANTDNGKYESKKLRVEERTSLPHLTKEDITRIVNQAVLEINERVTS